MSDIYCTDCKRNTEVVFDHSAGDAVCSECGLVLESRSIDETSEWRTFADDSGDHDPNRVGGPVNPLLSDAALSTVISRGANGSAGDPTLARLQNRGGDPDRAIVLAFKTISNMADRLSLVTTIKDRANEIYKRLEDQKCTRGRNLEALVAACIYIACRQEGKPRTVKEICSIVSGATKKEIGRAKEFIVKQLKVEMGESMEMGTIHAGDYLRRFCSNLGMSNEEVKVVQETVQKSGDFDIRFSVFFGSKFYTFFDCSNILSSCHRGDPALVLYVSKLIPEFSTKIPFYPLMAIKLEKYINIDFDWWLLIMNMPRKKENGEVISICFPFLWNGLFDVNKKYAEVYLISTFSITWN